MNLGVLLDLVGFLATLAGLIFLIRARDRLRTGPKLVAAGLLVVVGLGHAGAALQWATVSARLDAAVEAVQVLVPVLWLFLLYLLTQELARTELERSERKYRLMVDESSDGILVLDANGRVVEVNPALCAMLGYTRDEIVGRRVEELIPPEGLEQAPLRLHEVQDGVTVRTTRRLRRGDGGEVDVEVMARSVDRRRIQATLRDVSERRRIQDAVERSERRFRHLTERGWDVVALLEPDSSILFASSSVQRVLGYAPEDLVGTRALELVHPEDRETMRAELARLLEEADHPAREQFRALHADGSWRWLEAVASNLRDDPAVEALLANLRDVTDRKRVEDSLRRERDLSDATISSLPGVFCLFDATGRPVRWNANLELLTGYDEAEIRGMEASAFVPAEEVKLLEGKRREALVDGSTRFEGHLLTRSGRRIPFLFTGARLKLDAGVHVVALGIDLSEQRALEQQLIRAQRLESVGRLAGGVAHDFNNLVTAIVGHAEFLGERLTDPDARKDLEQIRRAADRAATLTNQLLAFARKRFVAPRTMAPNDLVHDMARMLRRLIGEDVELELDLAGDLWPVRADPGQMEQVLANLAVNARDAMPDGGRLLIRSRNVRLTPEDVAGRAPMPAGEWVCLSVEDDGSGISEEAMAHVFEPFFSTKPPGQGTGLGLATCYGIVKQAGGFIWITSRPGDGTRVDVLLPPARGEEEGEGEVAGRSSLDVHDRAAGG